MFKTRLRRAAIFAVIGFMLGIGLGLFSVLNPAPVARVVEKPSRALDTIAAVKVGGSFTLLDHTGKQVSEADYAGSYKLVFFGFTFCPAVCPTELQKMTRVMAELGPMADKIQPIFITVDPERDTVEAMGEYVSNFHPRLVGLTGSRAQIDDVLQKYRVFASKVEMPSGGDDYMMDHSAFMYLMGSEQDGDLISIYRSADSVSMIADDLKKRL